MDERRHNKDAGAHESRHGEDGFMSDHDAILEDLEEEEILNRELHELEEEAEELEKARERRRPRSSDNEQ